MIMVGSAAAAAFRAAAVDENLPVIPNKSRAKGHHRGQILHHALRGGVGRDDAECAAIRERERRS